MHIRKLMAAGFFLGVATVQVHAESEYVYFGTSPGFETRSDSPDVTSGIFAATLDTDTGELGIIGLQAELTRASWLVTHPKLPVVYSVATRNGMDMNSEIFSFAVNQESGVLSLLNAVDSGGRDSTHMGLDSASNTLAVASHASGNVSIIPIKEDGSLGPLSSSQDSSGSGPHRRQNGPHPHGAAFAPMGNYVLGADFGSDRILVYNFDPATRQITPAKTPYEQVPAGSGPRHLVFSPNGQRLYVNMELTAEVFVYAWDTASGRLSLVQTLDMYPTGYTGDNRSTSEISVSREGRFLYAALRGDQHSLVVYGIDQADGTLQEVQRLSAGGENPWDFAIDPTGEWLLVTNHRSSLVTVFSIDQTSGLLTQGEHSLSLAGVMTVTFYRQ